MMEVTSEVSSRRRFCVGGHLHTKGRRAATGARLEVYQMDDMAWWTHVVSLFMEEENICKS
jgi:hypothetical protein